MAETRRRKSKLEKRSAIRDRPLRRRSRGRLRRRAALAVAAVLVIALAGGLLFRNPWSGGNSDAGPRTAAIVDQLGLTQPNPSFVEEATATLERVGYAVDYYPGEEVTVDFYRDLPRRGYDVIILRVHSGVVSLLDSATGRRIHTEYVSLFTAEPYSSIKYPDEIRPRPPEEPAARLGPAFYYEGSPRYFAIMPGFVEHSMKGDFGGATVVMMGCDGLQSQETAEAFLERGASAFVSWNDQVSADHTDAATERLLEKLLVDGLPVKEAVAGTAVEVGADPFYGSELRMLAKGG